MKSDHGRWPFFMVWLYDMISLIKSVYEVFGPLTTMGQKVNVLFLFNMCPKRVVFIYK
jgi:hypothetical protein